MAGSGRLAVALALLALSLVGGQSCSGDCDRHGDDDMVLMQLASRVRGAGRRAAPVQHTGRTLYSTNPAESAKFVATYLNNATLLTLPACDRERAAVRIQAGALALTYVFVKDATVSKGSFSMEELIEKSTAQTGIVLNGSAAYSPWIDNHDGWGIWYLNCAKAAEDKLRVLVYRDPRVTARLQIPHTMWTFEFFGTDDEAGDIDALHELIEYSGISEDPDLCRNNDDAAPPPAVVAQLAWAKATFMSANVQAAADWSTAVLGATLAPGAYPWPPVPECEAAVWADLPEGLSLHFVLSTPYEQGMQPKVSAIAADVEETFLREAVGSGRFTQHMYNSVIFTVDSLDPYLKRLQDGGFPFMLVQSESQYIVFAHIPGNSILIQLRSLHASLGEAKPLDMCTLTF